MYVELQIIKENFLLNISILLILANGLYTSLMFSQVSYIENMVGSKKVENH